MAVLVQVAEQQVGASLVHYQVRFVSEGRLPMLYTLVKIGIHSQLCYMHDSWRHRYRDLCIHQSSRRAGSRP